MDIATLGIRVDSRDLQQGTADLERFGRSGDAATKRVESFGVAAARSALLFAGIGSAALAAGRALSSAQAYVSMTNSLRAMGLSGDQAVAALDQVAAVAQRTRAPLEATAQLYQRISIAGRDLGASSSDVLRFTENVSLALAQTGGSAASASGALTQLSQAMSGGTVRAEEFNSILEGAFPIAQAAANAIDGAAGSVGRLRTMVVDGKVSSKEFFDAIISQTAELEAAFANTVPTIGQAVTVLGDSFTIMSGKMDATLGVSSAIAQGILILSDNLDRVAVYAATAAVAVGVTYGGAAAIAAARTVTLTGALAFLRGALLRTGVGALVIAAGELAYRFMNLVQATGSFGEAVAALKDVAQEVFGDRLPKLMLGVGKVADGTGANIRSAILGALADVIDGMPDFVNSVIGAFVGTKDAIIAAWRAIPAALKAIMGNAMNGVIDTVQAGVGGVVSALNAIPGIDLAPPDLSGWKVEVGQVESAAGAAKAAFDAAFGADYTGKIANNLRALADEAGTAGDHLIGMGEYLIDSATAPLESLAALRAAAVALPEPFEDVAGSAGAAAAALDGGGAGGGKSGLSDAAKAADKAMADAKRTAKELADEIEQLEFDADPLKKYNAELAHLDELSKAGLSGGAYAHAVQELNDELAQSYPLIGDVSDAFGDFVAGGLQDFKGFVDSILGSFKSMLSEMIATAARNQIMIGMGITSGGASGAGGMSGALGGIGSAFMGGASSAISGVMSGGLSGGIASIGTALSGASTGLAGLATAAGAVAVPLAAAYVAFKFFSTSTKELDAGVRLNIKGNELLAESYKKVQKSRFFGLSKSTSESGSALEDTGLSDAYAAIYSGAEQAAWALGLSSKALSGYTDEIKISTKGMDEAAAQQAVLAALQEVQNGLAAEFFDALGKGAYNLIGPGEELGAAMDRIRASVMLASPLLNQLGGHTLQLGLAGATAATRFTDTLGGLESAAGAVQQYMGVFYSAGENARVTIGQLQAGLAALGLKGKELPQTREAFRAVIDRQLAAGQARNAAGLIRLSPLFDQWVSIREETAARETAVLQQAAAKQAAEQYGLYTELLTLQGNRAEIRKRELAQLLPANAALQKYIWSIEDAQAAANKAAAAEQGRESARAAVASERYGLANQLYTLQGKTSDLRQRELAALAPSNRAIQKWIWSLEDAQVAAEKLENTQAERYQLASDLYALQGKTNVLRQRELAQINPTNKALQQYIWALEDAQAAAETAAGIESERLSIQRQIWDLTENESAIRADVLAGLDASNRALQKEYYALVDQKEAQEALATASDEATAAIQAMIDAVDPAKFSTRFGYESALAGAASGLTAGRVTSTGVPIAAVPTAQNSDGLIAELQALKKEVASFREETRAFTINSNADLRKIRQNSDKDQTIGIPQTRSAS